MAIIRVPPLNLEFVVQEICKALNQENFHPRSWNTMREKDLWRELVACILGSRVKHQVVHSALERMKNADLLSGKKLTSSYNQFEQNVMDALKGSSKSCLAQDCQKAYPFSKEKSKQIRKAFETLYSHNNTIKKLLFNYKDAQQLRFFLVNEVSGLGPKQSSLFLRNIGLYS